MARHTIGAKIGAARPDGAPKAADVVGGLADVLPTSGQAAAKTAFEATLATLVADAGSPSQAHVTAANDAYTTLAATLGSFPTGGADVVVSIDSATVLTRTNLMHALEKIKQAFAGTNYLTP